MITKTVEIVHKKDMPQNPTDGSVTPSDPSGTMTPPIPSLTVVGTQIVELAQEYFLPGSVAAKVASNFRKAAEISKTPQELVTETFNLDEGDLPNAMSQALQVLLEKMAEDGLLSDMKKHLIIWEQISTGFEVYARDHE